MADDQPGEDASEPASRPELPPLASSADVFSYASATHSTIRSGSGEYSSSIEMAASGIASCLMAPKYGGNSTTPRPGGRSPWILPSQSEMWTWATRPFSSAIAEAGCPDSARWEMSRFAFTAGWSTRRRRNAGHAGGRCWRS